MVDDLPDIPKLPKRLKYFLLLAVSGVIIGALIVLVQIGLHQKHLVGQTSKLPGAIMSKVKNFKPYFLKSSYSTDFVLQTSSVSYQSGILIFSMKNPVGKVLTFTEEATPPHFQTDSLQTTKQFGTEFGQAYVTDQPDRTTGTLFTADHTWVIINAPNPIGVDLMQEILQALAPTSR